MAKGKGSKSSGSALAVLALVVVLGGGYFALKQTGAKAKRTAADGPQAATAQQGEAARPAGVVQVLPRECLAALVIRTDALGGILEGSGAAAIREDPAWDRYWSEIMAAAPPDAEMLYRLGSRIFEGELAVACLSLDVDDVLKPGYLPPLAMVGRVAQGSALLPGFIQSQMESADPEAAVRVQPYAWEGTDLLRVSIGRSNFYAAVVGTPAPAEPGAMPELYAVVSWRPDVASRIQGLGPGDQRLDGNPEFSAMARKFQFGESHALLGFLDTATLKEQLYEHYQIESRRDSLMEWQFMKTRRMLDFLGLQELRGIGFVVNQDEDGVHSRSYVHFNGLQGAMRMFAIPTEALDGVSFYPPSTVLCSVARLDVSNVWRTLRRDLSNIDLNFTEALNSFFSTTEATFGFDPELLVLSVGDEFGYGIVAAETVGAPYGTLATLRTKNNALVMAAVQLAQQLGLQHESVEYRQHTIHVFSELDTGDAVPIPFRIQPSLAYVDGYTLFGSGQSVLTAAIESRLSGNDITTAPEWDDFFRHLPGDHDGIGYISSTYRDCLLTFLPDRPRMFDLSRHADLFTSAVSVTDYSTNGLESHSYSPSGSDVLLSGLSLFAAMPDLLQMKEQWLDFQCRRVLEQVASAKQKMAEDFRLTEGTVVSADGSGKNTYDLIVGGYLTSTPLDPRTNLPIILNPIGVPPRVAEEGEIEVTAPPVDEAFLDG